MKETPMADFLTDVLQTIPPQLTRTFLACGHGGTRDTAAAALGISPSMVSKNLAAFEEAMGQHMFSRGYQGFVLLPAGKELHQQLLSCFATLGRLSEEFVIKKEGEHPLFEERKEIRITTTIPMASYLLPGPLALFNEEFPDYAVRINTVVGEMPEFGVDGMDILIWVAKTSHSQISVTPIAQYTMMMWASPDYIKDYGMPETLEDFAGHKFICIEGYSPSVLRYYEANWHVDLMLKNNIPILTPIYVNNSIASIRLAGGGAGIAYYAEEMIEQTGCDVIPMLPKELNAPANLWFMTYKNYARHPAIRRLRELFELASQKS